MLASSMVARDAFNAIEARGATCNARGGVLREKETQAATRMPWVKSNIDIVSKSMKGIMSKVSSTRGDRSQASGEEIEAGLAMSQLPEFKRRDEVYPRLHKLLEETRARATDPEFRRRLATATVFWATMRRVLEEKIATEDEEDVD